jgi:hypothetical protein
LTTSEGKRKWDEEWKGKRDLLCEKEKWEGKQEKRRGMGSEMGIVNIKLSFAF